MDKNDAELALLADLVAHPTATRQYAEQFMIEPEGFQDLTRRALWCELVALCDVDSTNLLQRAAKSLKLSANQKNEFLDLQSAVESQIAVRAHEFVMQLYNRRLHEAFMLSTQSISDCADAEALAHKAQTALASIPKPPPLGKPQEAFIAEEIARELAGEFPERLLHVPGFVDDVTAYTLESAHKPNRVLAFSGALALAAHLMGRRFTDLRRTRTNLYICALGPSGIGKEWPRRVARQVLKACRLSPSAQGEFASGEALEDLLARQPCALILQDEVQNLFKSFNDVRNAQILSKIKGLLTFFTASGEDYALRPRASDPNRIGQIIYDPSLTLYGTGNAEALFRSISLEVIEEGLLGRCLMFDTTYEAPPNQFEDETPVQLPRHVIAAAEEIAQAAGGRGSLAESFECVRVPYGEGVNARFNEILLEINKRRIAANKHGDRAAAALWARAPEKVSKLALIHAISARRQNPQITHAGVEWAWELLQFIVPRMLKRLEMHQAGGKITTKGREIIEFLVSTGGRASRRDIIRKLHVEGSKFMDEVEATLVESGEVTVVTAGRGAKIFRLANYAGK